MYSGNLRVKSHYGIADMLSASLLAGFILLCIYLHVLYDLGLLVLFFVTAYAAGVGLHFRKCNRSLYSMLLSLLGGLLLLTFGTWMFTLWRLPFYSIFLVVTLLLISWRRRELLRAGRNVYKIWRLHAVSSPGVLLAGFSVAILFLLYASQPVTHFDSLSSHLAIPSKILAAGRYDYDVIESLVFATPDLMLHMASVWLMALGGTKSLVYFVSGMGLLTVVTLLLLLRRGLKTPRWAATTVILLFGLTPLTLQQSVILYQDILPLPYLFLVLCLLVNSSAKFVGRNIHLLLFLLGVALFAKRPSLYMIFCIIPLALLMSLFAIIKGEVESRQTFMRIIVGLAFLFAIPACPIALVWYKTGNPVFPLMNAIFHSPYYSDVNFVDPFFKSELGLNIHSLLSIVLHTDKNMELAPLGVGVHLLLLPVVLLIPIILRDRKWIILSAVCLGSYFFSTKATYNIRYFLAAFVLSMPLTAYALNRMAQILPSRAMRNCACGIILTALLSPCIYFTFLSHIWSYVHFSPVLLKLQSRLDISPLSEMLDLVPDKKSSVFVNCPNPLRGSYPGFFVSTAWHNDFLLHMVNQHQIGLSEFLSFFEFVIESRTPPSFGFDLEPQKQSGMLLLVQSGVSYNLYRVQPLTKVAFHKAAEDGLSSVALSNTAFSAPGLGQRTIIKIDAEAETTRSIRCTMSWNYKDGSVAGSASCPIVLSPGRRVYELTIKTPHEEGLAGFVSMCSDDGNPVAIYDITLCRPDDAIMQKVLRDYSRKWPAVAIIK